MYLPKYKVMETLEWYLKHIDSDDYEIYYSTDCVEWTKVDFDMME